MVKLILERIDTQPIQQPSRISTILTICKEALDSNGYKVEYSDNMHHLIIDPDRGSHPNMKFTKEN